MKYCIINCLRPHENTFMMLIDQLTEIYILQVDDDGAVVDCKYGWIYNTTGLFTSAVTDVRGLPYMTSAQKGEGDKKIPQILRQNYSGHH